jgi:hypothetical protein
MMPNGSDLTVWMDGPASGVKAGGDDPREVVFDRVLWRAAPQYRRLMPLRHIKSSVDQERLVRGVR